jgi:hypothetical protein
LFSCDEVSTEYLSVSDKYHNLFYCIFNTTLICYQKKYQYIKILNTYHNTEAVL